MNRSVFSLVLFMGNGLLGINNAPPRSVPSQLQVAVPDRFVVTGREGEIDPELSLLSWLDGKNRQAVQYHDRRVGYHYPVQIKGASELPVPLSLLRRIARKGLPRFFLRGELPAVPPPPCPSLLSFLATPRATELIGDVSNIIVYLNVLESTGSRAYARTSDLSDALENHVRSLNGNLSRTCGERMTPRILCATLDRELQKSRLRPPLEVHHLMAIMAHESQGGQCFVRGKRGGHGLFQINSSAIAPCTPRQWQQLRDIMDRDLNQLSSGPQCRENPLVNMAENMRLLKEGQAILVELFSEHTPMGREEVEESFAQNPDLLLRLLFSNYNGGNASIRRTLIDLAQHNARVEELEHDDIKERLRKNPLDWEDLKLFYFARALRRMPAAQGMDWKSNRSIRNAIINVSYVDSFFGTNGVSSAFQEDSPVMRGIARRCGR